MEDVASPDETEDVRGIIRRKKFCGVKKKPEIPPTHKRIDRKEQQTLTTNVRLLRHKSFEQPEFLHCKAAKNFESNRHG